MGSRRAGNFREFAGHSRSTDTGLEQVEDALRQNKSAGIIVSTAVDVLAVTNPAIGTLVAAYKASKIIHNVASAADKAYQKSGDPNDAIKSAATEVVKTAIGETRGQLIGNLVDIGWSTMKGAAGLSTNDLQDRILTSAAKNTLDEVLPK